MISFGSTYKINQKQVFSPDFADKLYSLYKNGVDIVEEFTSPKASLKTGIFKRFYTCLIFYFLKFYLFV